MAPTLNKNLKNIEVLSLKMLFFRPSKACSLLKSSRDDFFSGLKINILKSMTLFVFQVFVQSRCHLHLVTILLRTDYYKCPKKALEVVHFAENWRES